MASKTKIKKPIEPAPAKKGKYKEKVGNNPPRCKTLLSYLMPLMVIIFSIPFILVLIIFTQRIAPNIQATFSEQNDLLLNVYKGQIELVLENFISHVETYGRLNQVITQIQTLQKPTKVDIIENTNNAEQYILFPTGNHRPNEASSPKITFIMINNAFNSTRGGKTLVEVENELLYVTTQVKSLDGKVLGALVATLPSETLFKPSYRFIQDQLAVRVDQVIEQTKTSIFQSANWNPDKALNLTEKFRDVFEVNAHPIVSPSTHISAEYFILGIALLFSIFGVLFTVTTLAIYNHALQKDLELTRDAILDLFRGTQPPKERFHLQNIAETYTNIYDNIQNSLIIAKDAINSNSGSLFNSNQSTGLEEAAAKASFSREQYLMETVQKPKPATKNATAGTETADILPSIFRAYDIRGIYPAELNEAGVEAIGRAIGSAAIAAGSREITIARDGRTTGPTLIKALCKGLKKTGIFIIDIGMVPTPLLYFAAKNLTGGSGVMLTGSHNPPDYNGLKIMIAGHTLYGDTITDLYKRIQNKDFAKGTGQVIEKDIMEDYQSELIGDIVLSRALKVVVDCGNGVTGVMVPHIFEQLGVETIGLFTEVDGTFPNHSPDPSQPKNMVALIEQVKAHGADLGLAFDGDGDRIGVITPSGEMVYADKLMMMFAEQVLANNPGQDIIFDVKCSKDLADIIQKAGGRPIMWKTGHSLIKAKLKETHAPLAGEMSGHIFFNDRWNGFDDAIYAAARLLEIISSTTNNLDELLSLYPERTVTPELHVTVTDESKFDIIKKLVAQGNFGNGKTNEIDGIRVDFEKGWGLIRASNTTPVLVARFEADSKEIINMIQGIFRRNLQAVAPGVKIPF